MAFIDIRIEGLEEVQKLVKIDTVAELNDWAKKILERASSKISIKQGELHLRFVEVGPENFNIEFRAPRDAVERIRQAIEELAPEMPIRTRAFFQALLSKIEPKKNTEE